VDQLWFDGRHKRISMPIGMTVVKKFLWWMVFLKMSMAAIPPVLGSEVLT